MRDESAPLKNQTNEGSNEVGSALTHFIRWVMNEITSEDNSHDAPAGSRSVRGEPAPFRCQMDCARAVEQ